MNSLNKFQAAIIFALILALSFMQSLPAQTIGSSTPLTINPEGCRRIDKIVAVVNDEVITQIDVDRVLATIEAEYKTIYSDPQECAQKLKQAEENIVNQMLQERLILCEAKKFDIKVDENKIEARIDEIKDNFPSERVFEQALELEGLTQKDLRDRFYDQEIMKKVVDYFVRSKIKIDPMEIKEFYQSHKSELVHPEKAYVKTIFVGINSEQNEYWALQKARRILEQLRRGDSFEELEKDLGFVEKGQLIKEIDETIFKLQPGEFSDVIKVSQGYRIFKVEKKEPPKVLTFSESQEIIDQILYREKFSKIFQEWIEELKQNAYIKIN